MGKRPVQNLGEEIPSYVIGVPACRMEVEEMNISVWIISFQGAAARGDGKWLLRKKLG